MNCRRCGYALWNLRSRTCPECGDGFLPSQFDFVVNAVRFMCPECAQPYYGTGDRGHLVPAEFACVTCGRQVAMDEMVLLPTEGVAEERTKLDRFPWAERGTRGFLRGWLGTIGMALVKPTRLMRAARDTSAGSAWWFALITHLAIAAVSFVPLLVFAMLMPGPGPMGAMLTGMGAPAVLVVVLAMVFMALWGVLAHGVLLVTGPTAEGIGRTYVAICFASAVNVFAAIPCLGFYVALLVLPIWWSIAMMLMLIEAHKVGPWRAILAGLVAPLITYGAVALCVFWMIAMMKTATVAMAAAAAAQPTAQTQSLTQAILRAATDGAGPAHASGLIGAAGASDMLLPGTGTTKADIPVGMMSLERYFTSPPEVRAAALQAAADVMPPGVIAHRWGDFVFTYHGIDLQERDGRLWIVIASPNPGSRALVPQTAVTVGKADGTTTQIPVGQFPAMLSAQNELRVELGLPPLPDPATVTHGAPAVSPP